IRRQRAGVAMATLALAALLGLSACSSTAAADKKTSDPGGGTHGAPNTPPPADTSAATSTHAPPPAANTLTVDALDAGMKMSFRISGTPHAGLVAITLANKCKYAHEIGLARVNDGVTLAQVKAALMSTAPDAEAKAKKLQVDPDHEISAPGIIGPGLTEQATVPLVAGHYVLTCFLPGPDGMPHAAMGMIDEFTVAAGNSSADAPATAGVIELTDTGITVPANFGTGGTFQVKNTGAAPHDFSLAKLAGKPLLDYFQCVGTSFSKGTPIDKCPGTLEGGVSFLAPGATAYVTITLPAGKYSYVSTQGDGKDFQAGLHGEFAVA
ncbi:MAG: hypothetical protein ACRDZY_10845, partial [Acidimicrobiales bacterium]